MSELQPGLYLYRSNRIEVLVQVLAELLSQPSHRPVDPFAPIHVTVGSLGMERWLRHELASRHGICANVEFPFPSQLLMAELDRFETSALGDARGEGDDPWNSDVLVWRLLEIFREEVPAWTEQHGAAVLNAYLEDGDVADVSPRELELAERLADIFDGYVTYRPTWAISASRGELALDPEDELRWQVEMWNALRRRAGEGRAGAHLAERLSAMLEAARVAGASDVESSPEPGADPTVRIFGLTSLPPSQLSLIEALARRRPVELYLVCPSHLYWANLHQHRGRLVELAERTSRDEFGERLRGTFGDSHVLARPHPLLSSLGRVSRDLQIVLERLPSLVVDDRDLHVDPVAGGATSALAHLQSDIANLRHPSGDEGGSIEIDERDDSIQFHACHGATRQVEVLRDVLLHLFDRHPHLEPRDVVVMCPDIDVYAPLISAVFDQGRGARLRGPDGAPLLDAEGWGPEGAPRIPFVVADLSVRRQNPVADALLRVLGLGSASGRVSASAVLDLLALEPVRRRFGIEQEDLETIATWIREAGIRWGVDAEDRSRAGQPALDQNTWRFGIERLALGVVMADDGPMLSPSAADRSIAPYDPMEGARVQLLGRLMDFTHALFDELKRLDAPRSMVEWVSALAGDPEADDAVAREGTMGRLTALAPEARWLGERVLETLEQLADAAKRGGNTRRLRRDAVSTALEHRFSVASSSAQPHTGAVTFGTLMPYRSVPYRVVCLLGMDEDAFPRNPIRPRFDRVALEPRVGDRDVRDEDRHLLLEAIGAAREHLVVTYAGRDVRTNEERPPAPPIGELQDVLRATFGREALARMCREHPLQAFSPRNFSIDAPWSHDRRLWAGAKAVLEPTDDARPFFGSDTAELPTSDRSAADVVTLDELVTFMREPSRFMLQRGYGVYLGNRSEHEATDDREPTELNGLGKWRLTHELLAARLAPGEADGLGRRVERMRALGTLPFGVGGELAVEAAGEAVDQLWAHLVTAAPNLELGAVPTTIEIDVPLEIGPGQRVRLVGAVPQVFGDTIVRLDYGDKLDAKRGLRPWLQYLAAVVSMATRGDVPIERAVVGLAKPAAAGSGKPPKLGVHELALRGDDPVTMARAALANYVGWVCRGRFAAVPVFSRASFRFVDKLLGRGSPFAADLAQGERLLADGPGDDVQAERWAEALRAAHDAFSGDDYTEGDAMEPHVARVWPTGWTDDDAFIRHALELWWPLRASTTSLKAKKSKSGGKKKAK